MHKRYVHLLDHCNLHSESLFYFVCHTNFILFKCFKSAQVLWTCFLYLHLQELWDSFYKPLFLYKYVSISPAHAQRFYLGLRLISILVFETYLMRSDSVDLISVFNCLGCLRSTKNYLICSNSWNKFTKNIKKPINSMRKQSRRESIWKSQQRIGEKSSND